MCISCVRRIYWICMRTIDTARLGARGKPYGTTAPGRGCRGMINFVGAEARRCRSSWAEDLGPTDIYLASGLEMPDLTDLGGFTRRNKVRLEHVTKAVLCIVHEPAVNPACPREHSPNEVRINSPQANMYMYKGPLPSRAGSRRIFPWIPQAPAPPQCSPRPVKRPAQHVPAITITMCPGRDLHALR